jgi:branched-chain amino acid aminotransferase
MFPIVSINGQITDPSSPQISPFDRGFTLGDGVFETIKVANGTPWYLERHLQRLQHGAEMMGIPYPPDIPHWVEGVVSHIRSQGAQFFALRVTLTRGAMHTAGLSVNCVPSPTVTIVAYALPEPPQNIYEQGISVRIASARRNERALATRIKTTSYAESILALREAQAEGYDDAIFLNTYNFVAEASASNIFLCLNGVVVTPAITQGILPGITRAVVLQLAKDVGFSVAEREVSDEELLNSDEVFLTSSLRGIVPVVRVGEDAIGHGTPGTITRQLIKAYESATARV